MIAENWPTPCRTPPWTPRWPPSANSAGTSPTSSCTGTCTRNILRAEREPWLVVDPKGYVGDPAYDAGALIKARMRELAGSDSPEKAALRMLEIFAEAAELDLARVRRWAQFHAVDAVFWGLRHGFRVARSGDELDRIMPLVVRLACLLTEES